MMGLKKEKYYKNAVLDSIKEEYLRCYISLNTYFTYLAQHYLITELTPIELTYVLRIIIYVI